MDGLNVILGNLSIRCLNALFLDLPNAFFEIGNVAGRWQEHKEILIDVFETAINIGCELSDQLSLHVIFHSEKSEELT